MNKIKESKLIKKIAKEVYSELQDSFVNHLTQFEYDGYGETVRRSELLKRELIVLLKGR